MEDKDFEQYWRETLKKKSNEMLDLFLKSYNKQVSKQEDVVEVAQMNLDHIIEMRDMIKQEMKKRHITIKGV